MNEACEQNPRLPGEGEERYPQSGCCRVGTQCVDVSAPVVLTPSATVTGPISAVCQGCTQTCCKTTEDGASCLVTFTQRICVSVPVRYSVTMEAETPTISCAENCCCTQAE